MSIYDNIIHYLEQITIDEGFVLLARTDQDFLTAALRRARNKATKSQGWSVGFQKELAAMEKRLKASHSIDEQTATAMQTLLAKVSK
jgi:hypothetical protein